MSENYNLVFDFKNALQQWEFEKIEFYIEASILNAEYSLVSHIMHLLNLEIFSNTLNLAEKFHSQKISLDNIRTQQEAKKARILKKKRKKLKGNQSSLQ